MIPVSFPNQPDDGELGVFQAVPNCAVGFHFRPLTGFGARFLFVRPVDGAFHFDPASPAMKHRCVASSGRGAGQKWILMRYGKTGVTYRAGSKSEAVLVGATLWLFAFWASWYIPSADESPESANTEIRAGFCPMESEGLCLPPVWSGGPSGGRRGWETRTLARIAEHSVLAARDVGRATADQLDLLVVPEFASRPCSDVATSPVLAVWELTSVAELPVTSAVAFWLAPRPNRVGTTQNSIPTVLVKAAAGRTVLQRSAMLAFAAGRKDSAEVRQSFENLDVVRETVVPAAVAAVAVAVAAAAAVAAAVVVVAAVEPAAAD